MRERNGPAETDVKTDRLCEAGGLRETLGRRQAGGSRSLRSLRLSANFRMGTMTTARVAPSAERNFLFVSGAMFSDFVVCELLQRC